MAARVGCRNSRSQKPTPSSNPQCKYAMTCLAGHPAGVSRSFAFYESSTGAGAQLWLQFGEVGFRGAADRNNHRYAVRSNLFDVIRLSLCLICQRGYQALAFEVIFLRS